MEWLHKPIAIVLRTKMVIKWLWGSLKMMLILSLVPAVYCHYLKTTQASTVVHCVSRDFELYQLNKHRTNLYLFTMLRQPSGWAELLIDLLRHCFAKMIFEVFSLKILWWWKRWSYTRLELKRWLKSPCLSWEQKPIFCLYGSNWER